MIFSALRPSDLLRTLADLCVAHYAEDGSKYKGTLF